MNLDGGFQLQDLRGILRRRGKVAGASALVLVLAAYWLAMALPNVYTSYATVLVEPQAVDPELVKAGVAESDLNRRLHLMTAQILSRPRLSRIIDDLKLYKEESETMTRDQVIDLMRSQVRVEPVIPELEQPGAGRRGPVAVNQFQIFYDNYDRTLARDVAQRLANDFIETHIDDRVRTSQKSLEFIEDELDRLAGDIQKVEAEIAMVKGDNPGRLPDDMATNQRRLERMIMDLSRLRGEYAEAASDESFYMNQAAVAKSMGGGAGSSPANRLETLRLELAQNLSRGFTAKHPDVVRAREEIAQLERIIADSGSGDGPTLDPLAQQNEAAARRAALRKGAAEEEILRLEAQANEVRDLLMSTPEVAEQLDALNRRYEHLFNTYQDFSRRHNEAVVQAQLERRQLGEQFRVLEPAFEADEPSAPNRVLILLLGAIFAVAAGMGVGLLMEATDSSPHDARQLQSRMRLPVLAQIPQIWLESDRVRQRRARIRTALATTGLVFFALVGGAANYFWVNGMPGFLSSDPPAAQAGGPKAAKGGG